jgi:hypothetical protein
MRLVLTILAVSSLLAACVKRQSKDPVPKVEFIDIIGPSRTANGDTATLILGYEDGDGDLFVDNVEQGDATVIVTFYYFDEQTQTFRGYISPESNDTVRSGYAIKQPDNGYYKGKAIKGEIFVPLSQFRQDDSYKVIKFRGFLMDSQGHQSNYFSSPGYTLSF